VVGGNVGGVKNELEENLTILISHSAGTFKYPFDKGKGLSIKHVLTEITNL